MRRRGQSREELRGNRQEQSEDSQALLESEDDLDQDPDRPQTPDPDLHIEPQPEKHSVSEPMRTEFTEYDRL